LLNKNNAKMQKYDGSIVLKVYKKFSSCCGQIR
jgi:hypothetical protein